MAHEGKLDLPLRTMEENERKREESEERSINDFANLKKVIEVRIPQVEKKVEELRVSVQTLSDGAWGSSPGDRAGPPLPVRPGALGEILSSRMKPGIYLTGTNVPSPGANTPAPARDECLEALILMGWGEACVRPPVAT
uniref:Retrotransposon protein, putative, unclassified n=1 Tax=Oryza sativa subsp. japonica TaxID=39947 RepID=Q2QMI7_ORYSJ|nr:retrotransposon protein, putative, unclassified [Oryza sativa Japonica Group]